MATTKPKKSCCGNQMAAAKKKGAEIQKMAAVEFGKIKKEMNAAAKKAEVFIKKNPAEAALISAGILAALGSAVALISSAGKKKK